MITGGEKEENFPRKQVKGLIYCLDEKLLATLMVLLQLCQLIIDAQEHTRMDVENLSRCIGPSIMFDEDETSLDVLKRDGEGSSCHGGRFFKR